MKVKVEFPCGYKFEVFFRSLFGEAEFDGKNVCPLHGKNCSKSEQPNKQIKRKKK